MNTRPTNGCGTTGTTCACTTESQAHGATFRPSVDIIESPDKFTITADLPGVKPEQIDLVCEQGVLTLKATVLPRTREGARQLLSEYGVGGFERTFKLGEGIASDTIGAELKNGVLTLTLPKSEASTARKIEIRSN